MADDGKTSQEMLDMWRIYRTTKEMCRDRVGASKAHSQSYADRRSQGYNILDEECNMKLDEFQRRFGTESGQVKYARTSATGTTGEQG